MKLQLVAVGTKMPDWVQTGFTEYLRRFPKDMPFELIEIPAGKRGKLQLHALTPEFFQFIQATALFLHDMDNHIAQIHDNPVGAVFTFYAER